MTLLLAGQLIGCSHPDESEAKRVYIEYLDNMIAGDLATATALSTGWAQKEVQLEKMYRHFLKSNSLHYPNEISSHNVHRATYHPDKNKYLFNSTQIEKVQQEDSFSSRERKIEAWGTVVLHEGEWKVAYTLSSRTGKDSQKIYYGLTRLTARKALIDEQYLHIKILGEPTIPDWENFLMLYEKAFNGQRK